MPRQGLALRRSLTALALIGIVAAAAPAGALANEDLARGSADRSVAVGASDAVSLEVPAGQVGVLSRTQFMDVAGGFNVAGEILNNTSSRRWHIDPTPLGVRITYRNASGDVIRSYPAIDTPAATYPGYSFLLGLSAGAVSPFFLRDPSPPASYASWGLATLQGTAHSFPPDGALDVTLGTPFNDGLGQRHYPGSVRNRTSFTIQDVDANLTVYRSNGVVVDTWWDATTPDVLAAGASAPFDIILPEPPPNEFRWTIVAQAFRGNGSNAKDIQNYVTSWPNYFDDVGTSTFRGDIVWNAEEGITTGCGLGRFCPKSNVPRDQMASFLARALGLGGTAPNAFTDDNGNIHEPNINRIAAEAIATGCGGTNYCPSANVPRDQMASFLARARGLGGSPPDAFADDAGNIHELNINRVAAAGIATGCSASNYCPGSLVTREQMAAFLRRAFD